MLVTMLEMAYILSILNLLRKNKTSSQCILPVSEDSGVSVFLFLIQDARNKRLLLEPLVLD